MEHSREFREELRGELSAWEADGVLSAGAARALISRYELDDVGPAPAAAKDRSAAVAGIAAVVFAGALALALAPAGPRDGALLPLAALGAALATAPLGLRGDALAPAAAALRAVGRWLFYLTAFALSFVSLAEALRFRSAASPGLLAALPSFLLALAAVLAGLRRGDVDAHARGEALLLTAAAAALAAGLFLESGVGAAVVANLALAFLAAGRIARGLSARARGPFFEGLLLAAVIAGSRILHVTLAGWPRVTGAFLVAAAATAAGLFFERRRSRAPHEAGVNAAQGV